MRVSTDSALGTGCQKQAYSSQVCRCGKLRRGRIGGHVNGLDDGFSPEPPHLAQCVARGGRLQYRHYVAGGRQQHGGLGGAVRPYRIMDRGGQPSHVCGVVAGLHIVQYGVVYDAAPGPEVFGGGVNQSGVVRVVCRHGDDGPYAGVVKQGRQGPSLVEVVGYGPEGGVIWDGQRMGRAGRRDGHHTVAVHVLQYAAQLRRAGGAPPVCPRPGGASPQLYSV